MKAGAIHFKALNPMPRHLLTVSFLALALLSGPAWAQLEEEGEEENQPLNATPIGEDAEVLDQFKRVESRYIPRGEWSRIVRYYQKQLDRTDHGMFSEDGEIYLPLSVHCHHRIAQLPAAGLEAYRRRVDPRAARLYDEALKATRLAPLSKLLRFYFNSTSGDKALVLAGSLYMELGRFRQALKVLQMVHPSLGPGHLHYPDTRLDLDPIQARIGYCLAVLGERYQLEQLFGRWDYKSYWGSQQGEAYRDDLTRLAARAHAPSTLQTSRWPYIYGDREHANLGFQVNKITGPKQWIFPDSHVKKRPLFQGNFASGYTKPQVSQTVCVVAGERIYTIQEQKIQAANIFNGKLVWEADIDYQVNLPTRSGWRSTMPTADAIKNWRMVADPTACSLSLVGKQLYSIQRTSPRLMNRGANQWINANILRVYDTTREYKSLSEVPAFGGSNEKRTPYKNVYWLSTPVEYEGRVYLPAESEGSYKIFCLDAASLKLIWSKQVAGVTDGEPQYNQVRIRAAAGSALAAGQGHLYWATQNGAVICLDATTGEKVWVTRYRRQGESKNLPAGVSPATGRWWLSPPILAAGRLIVAPRDAHQLLCYDANTGEVMWKSPQKKSRMLAGASRDHVYTVGETVLAISVLTGMMDGESLKLGKLTGHPVLTDREIYLPTSTGLEVISLASMAKLQYSITLATLFRSAGETDAESHPRLGNLILSPPGILFSAHSDGIVAFYSKGLQVRQIAEVTAKLRQRPDDLALRHLRAERYQQFDQPEKSLADYITLYDSAKKKKSGTYKRWAQEGIIELSRDLSRTAGDPKYILLALKYAGKRQQAPLKLLLAQSHEKQQQYRQALALYLELRSRFSGQLIEIDDRRVAQLDVLLDQAIRRVRQHLPQPTLQDRVLRAAVQKLKDPSGIPKLLRGLPRSPDRALAEWIHAYWMERQQGKLEDGISLCRAILNRYPGTPAALGCLWRLVEYYERENFPGRALHHLTRIRDSYATVAWPVTTLEQLQIHWQPQKAPKKQGADDKKQGADDKKQGDEDKKKGDEDKKRKDGPEDGMAYFKAKRSSARFKQFSLPGKTIRSRGTKYPLRIDDKRKLIGSGQTNYSQGHVVGAFAQDNMIFIWANKRIEARGLKNWNILWRTNDLQAATTSSQAYASSQKSKLLREVPRVRVFRSQDRAIVVYRNAIQAVHLTTGRLKWQIKLKQDKPFGFKPTRRSYRSTLTPPPIMRLRVTLDRVYTLTPGGTLTAYDSQGGKIIWSMKIDRMRTGQLYVSGDRVMVLAAIGAEGDHHYRLYRWNEITTKLESNTRLDQPLVGMTAELGPGGILYLAAEQTLTGIEAVSGKMVWELVYRDRIRDIFSMPEGRLLVGSGGRFELLDGRTGGILMRGGLGSQRILRASTTAEEMYLLCTPSLNGQGTRVGIWIGAFDLAKRKLNWETNFQSAYYTYYYDLLPLRGGAVLVGEYAMSSRNSKLYLYAGGSRKQTYDLRRSNSRNNRQDLSVRSALVFNGHVFIPEQKGIRVFREK